MFINYKREIYALAHLNLSTASFKCLSYIHTCIHLFDNKGPTGAYVLCLSLINILIFAVLELWLIQLQIDCLQFFYIIVDIEGSQIKCGLLIHTDAPQRTSFYMEPQQLAPVCSYKRTTYQLSSSSTFRDNRVSQIYTNGPCAPRTPPQRKNFDTPLSTCLYLYYIEKLHTVSSKVV